MDERLNRMLDELLQELRVVLQGVQVLMAFLLAVPFASHFDQVDDVERDLYFAALLLSVTSVLFLMAPSIQHRVLFRHHDKPYLVASGNVFAILGVAALALAIVVSLTLVTHFLFGSGAAWVVGASALAAFTAVWYVQPLGRRIVFRRAEREQTLDARPSGAVSGEPAAHAATRGCTEILGISATPPSRQHAGTIASRRLPRVRQGVALPIDLGAASSGVGANGDGPRGSVSSAPRMGSLEPARPSGPELAGLCVVGQPCPPLLGRRHPHTLSDVSGGFVGRRRGVPPHEPRDSKWSHTGSSQSMLLGSDVQTAGRPVERPDHASEQDEAQDDARPTVVELPDLVCVSQALDNLKAKAAVQPPLSHVVDSPAAIAHADDQLAVGSGRIVVNVRPPGRPSTHVRMQFAHASVTAACTRSMVAGSARSSSQKRQRRHGHGPVCLHRQVQ